MAPNLSLVYNSQGGDGLAGQGWELAGLSMIHRCPKTRVQDGQGQLVSMGDLIGGDGVCLDGKRLFESQTTAGQFETELKDYSTITRVDDPFSGSQVLPPSGSVFFKVVTKSGETRYYGARKDNHTAAPLSRVSLTDEHLGSPSTLDGKENAVWLLDRVV